MDEKLECIKLLIVKTNPDKMISWECECGQKNFEPFTLADVLMILEDWEYILEEWDLKDDSLDHQNDEILDHIYETIRQKFSTVL